MVDNSGVEHIVRTSAQQRGLKLIKSKAHGTYGLVDENNVLVAGDSNTAYGLSLSEAAAVVGKTVVIDGDGLATLITVPVR